jgi:hypothetical protein
MTFPSAHRSADATGSGWWRTTSLPTVSPTRRAAGQSTRESSRGVDDLAGPAVDLERCLPSLRAVATLACPAAQPFPALVRAGQHPFVVAVASFIRDSSPRVSRLRRYSSARRWRSDPPSLPPAAAQCGDPDSRPHWAAPHFALGTHRHVARQHPFILRLTARDAVRLRHLLRPQLAN